jgi:hypothetical protein
MACADKAEAARVRDGSRKLSGGNPCHASLQNRVLNIQQLAKFTFKQ